jgi:hypothetical protein
MTFDNAVIECKKKGMQLAVAESLVDNKCLYMALAEKGIVLSISNFFFQNIIENHRCIK